MIREGQTTEINKQMPENSPEVGKLANLFFLSYRFSQGVPVLQKHIFKYLAFSHPDWRMSEGFINDLRKRAAPRIKKFVAGSAGIMVHSTELMPMALGHSIRDESENMASIFNGQEGIEDRQTVLLEIASGVIDKDHNWLVIHEESGRPRSASSQVGPVVDPFLSHFCYYALEENKTGAPEYDKMFAEARETLWGILRKEEKSYEDNLISRKFKETIAVYVKTHKGKKRILRKKIPEDIGSQVFV